MPLDVEYNAPLFTNALALLVSVPYAFTLSVQNSGQETLHAWKT